MEKKSSSKDYKDFKKFIAKLEEHLRRIAKQQGYHNANAFMESATEEIAEALDNLAMAITVERGTIKEVQAKNNQLLELTKKMLDKMDRMQ
eukprot:14137993-Ditylum_brightwellii.AAC.1